MTETIELNEGGSALFHEGARMTFFTEGLPKTKGGRFGPTPSEKEDPVFGDGKIAYWGAGNDFPQQIAKEIRESDLLRPLIRKQAKTMIGQGLVYGTTRIDEVTGEEKLVPMRELEIDRWLKRTNVVKFMYESWSDWITYGNVFPEFQMAYDSTVAGVFCQDATRCRLSTKDDLGRIKHCYVSGKWEQGASVESKDVIRLTALDPDFDVAGQIVRSNQARYVMPIRLLVDDVDYYGEAPWHGLIASGWIEVAKAIPKLKKYLMENMMLIKYHVEIGQEYWPLAYPGWKDKTPDERKKLKKDTVDNFSKWAAGLEKAGRTLMTEMLLDELKKETYRSLWKITPLKLEIPTGAYVEDSQEADFHIVRAFMDPALFGIAPGKDRNSAGSGSDKRIAHTHHILDNYVDSEMLLAPLDVVAEVNGWHEKYGGGQMLKFWFKAYHAATLDRTLGAISEKPQTQENDAAV
jgi:hypothetical protein